MSTVFKELKIRRKEVGDLGLEIEVEGTNLPRLEQFWRNEQDGSLKGAETAEYVLATPMALAGVKDALAYLERQYVLNGTIVDNSVRAGVHVHVNCQQLTMIELYNFITLYLLMENLLVRWCGSFREGNLFCLRAIDAEYVLHVLRVAARDQFKNFRSRFHHDHLRYSSMNLKALGDYGSLEFRAMRGTRDLDLIYKWAETLLNLREFARTFENPTHIIEGFSMEGIEAFIQKALGDNAPMFLGAAPDYSKLLWQGMRNAQDVAYCTDWNVFDPKMIKIGNLEFPETMKREDINEPLEDF